MRLSRLWDGLAVLPRVRRRRVRLTWQTCRRCGSCSFQPARSDRLCGGCLSLQ